MVVRSGVDPIVVAQFCLPIALATAVFRDEDAAIISAPALWTAVAVWAFIISAVTLRAVRGELAVLPHLWPIGPIILYLVANALMVGDGYGREKVFYWLALGLPLLVWPSVAGVTSARLRALLVGQIAAGVVLLAPMIMALDRELYGKGTYLHAGVFGGAAVVAIVGSFEPGQRPLHKLGLAVVAVMTGLGLFVTGARGALLFAGAVALAQLLRRSRLALTACAAGLAWVALAVFPDVAAYVEDTLSVRFTPEAFVRGIGVRADLYADAMGLFGGAPLLGAGAGRFASLYFGLDPSFSYPHNLPLEIAAEFGLVGLALSATVTVGVLGGYRRMRRATDPTLAHLSGAVIALTVYLFFHTLKSGDLNSHRLYFLWLGVCWAGCLLQGRSARATMAVAGPSLVADLPARQRTAASSALPRAVSVGRA